MKHLKTIKQLIDLKIKHKGKKIGLCHGVFDLLHIGHIEHFLSAKRKCDILVVSITSDKFVNKGPFRPAFNQNYRLKFIASLEMVDYVYINDAVTSEDLINHLKPNFYFKGIEYKKLSNDYTKNIIKEKNILKKIGSKIIYTDDIKFSSTKLINQNFEQFNRNQKNIINNVKKNINFNEIFKKLSKLKILLLGEPIIDKYIFTSINNALSSKNPSISSNYISEEIYMGGVLSTSLVIAEFVKSVDLIIPNKKDDQVLISFINNKPKNLKIHFSGKEKVIQKIRFINKENNNKLFEYIKNSSCDQIELKKLNRIISSKSKYDALMINDFGHGLIQEETKQLFEKINLFKCLNVQTNSSNYGFNLVTKYKNNSFNFLCIDTREALLAIQNLNLEKDKILEIFINKLRLQKKSVDITLGKYGSNAYYKNKIYSSPSFASNIIDATGSGDAYFAISSILRILDVKAEERIFLSNLYAGLYSKIIGNKEIVKKPSFIKAIKSIID